MVKKNINRQESIEQNFVIPLILKKKLSNSKTNINPTLNINKVLKSIFFIILSCEQLNLEPQSKIRNFKKASNEF